MKIREGRAPLQSDGVALKREAVRWGKRFFPVKGNKDGPFPGSDRGSCAAW